MSMNRTCAISSGICFLISVDILGMRFGMERERSDKDRQNPFGRVVGRHDCRAYLDNEPRNYCVAQRDTINLPLF